MFGLSILMIFLIQNKFVLLFFIKIVALCIVQNQADKLYLKKLGLRIRSLRIQKDMSQLDVGVAMDNYAEQVGRIERGLLDVRLSTLKKIAKALDISLSELLDF
jgi:ribosome-binding protein aMBF1 (putative translation factor)